MRIASLLPSATEIACTLGLRDDLVAVTHECDYPIEVRGKPVVTSSLLRPSLRSGEIDRHIREFVHAGSSIYALDSERLEELKPDLILTQELCDVCAVSYSVVEAAARRLEGETQVVSLEPQSLEDVFENIRLVGRLTRRAALAEETVARFLERIALVSARVRGRRPRQTIGLEWIDPPFNAGHWTPGLIELAGGKDALGNPGQPARALSWSQVAGTSAEVVVVMACGFTLARSLEEATTVAMRLPGREVWVVDGNSYFSRPGPRLVESVEIMAGILHPDAVTMPSADVARRLA